MERLDQLRREINTLYGEINRKLGGVPGILKESFEGLQESGGMQAAAALSYYLLFSLFPLLLVSVVIVSFALDLNSDAAFQRTVTVISRTIPVSENLIVRNLRAVLDRRSTVSFISLLSILWSASSAFRVLSYNVNRAWSNTTTRGFFGKGLMGVAMVGAIVLLLLLLSLMSSTLTAVLPTTMDWFGQEIAFRQTWLWSAGTRVVPLIFSITMYFAVYQWVPQWNPNWRSAAWSAVTMALLWELAKVLFAQYVSSGLVRYEMVYGSLGTVVALLFWAYISSAIIVFGAYLTASLERRRRSR